MAKIVIAEDDAHVLRLMSIWLQKLGHEVVEARNGVEAKAALGAGGADLLVTDVNMPECDGIALVEWMREEAGLHIPVIALSARCDQDRLAERLARMRVSLHAKPFSPSRLSAEISAKLAASAPAANSLA
jgi:CheY-like chemotaxis protein